MSTPTRQYRPTDGGQVEVGGPDDLDAVHVHQLVVEDLVGECHLARTRREVGEVEAGRS